MGPGNWHHLLADARQRERSHGGRLPTADFVAWETFPFEEPLSVRPVQDWVVPEPPRRGAGLEPCGTCMRPDDEYLWCDVHWRSHQHASPPVYPSSCSSNPGATMTWVICPPH